MNMYCREIDFVDETVRTLAGNGTKGSDYKGGEKGTSQARWNQCIIQDFIASLIHIKHGHVHTRASLNWMLVVFVSLGVPKLLPVISKVP